MNETLARVTSWALLLLRLTLLLVAFFLFAGFFLLIALITIPILLVRTLLAERRKVRQLADQDCPHCGKRLGEAAARKARTRLQTQYGQAFRELRAGRIRLPNAAPMLELECPHCGKVTRYAPGSGLRVMEADESGPEAGPAQQERLNLSDGTAHA